MHVQRRLDLLFDERIVGAVRDGRINTSVAVELKSLPEAVREDFVTRAAEGEAFDVMALREVKRQARAVIWGEPGRQSVTNRYSGGEATPIERLTSSPAPPSHVSPDAQANGAATGDRTAQKFAVEHPGLDGWIGALDPAALDALLGYAIQCGWSCTQLRQMIKTVRGAAR
jgi:hypothetical protein